MMAAIQALSILSHSLGLDVLFLFYFGRRAAQLPDSVKKHAWRLRGVLALRFRL